jgi:hypothetical protein
VRALEDHDQYRRRGERRRRTQDQPPIPFIHSRQFPGGGPLDLDPLFVAAAALAVKDPLHKC